MPKDTERDDVTSVEINEEPVKQNPWQWLLHHKKITVPLTVIVLIGPLAAIPGTRFALAALVVKQDFQLKIVDADNKKPVTSASVAIGGKTVMTDAKGIAKVHVAVGSKAAKVSKKYYKSDTYAVTVPILKQKDIPTFSLKATGRQVPIAVINKITGKPIGDVVVRSGESEATTDKQGKATLVIPVNQKQLQATFSLAGYAMLTQVLNISPAEADNTAALVPSGMVYFLSNASGKIDVVSTNLDGSNRQTVIAGTGKEDNYQTTLLASRDWKYLALIAKRDSAKAKVYLITTSSNELTTMDEGDATFQAVGWSGSRFVYEVNRNKQAWEDKRQALKAFDATSKKLTTLDETKTEGGQGAAVYEDLQTAYILDNEIVYAKRWYYGSGYNTALMATKQNSISSVSPDGKAKKVVKSYATQANGYYPDLSLKSYAPQELYVLYDTGEGALVEEYENGQIKKADITRDEYYNKPYPTYLVSPAGEQAFWTESRDGSQKLFIGDKTGENKKEVASLDQDFSAYGWFTDNYLIISNKRKTLYLMPVSGVASEKDLLKASDYYSGPSLNGYGYGYGGL